MQQAAVVGGGVPFNAAAWGTVLGEYDFSLVANIAASAGLVSSVTAKSGSTAPLTAVAGDQPVTGTRTAPGGQNVLDFGPANGSKRLSLAGVTQAQPVTVAVVYQADVQASNMQLFGDDPGTYVGTLAFSEAGWNQYASGGSSTSLPIDTGWHAAVYVFNGASSVCWEDGTFYGATNPGTSGITRLVCGNYGTSGSGYGFDGGIAHIIWYVGAVADPGGLSLALRSAWNMPICPAQLAGVVGRFDSSYIGSLVGSGGKLSQWTSLVGTKHLLQANGSFQYTYTSAFRNGKLVLNVPSGTAWMEATGLVYSGTTFTIIYIGTWAASGPWGRGITVWGTAPSYLEWILVSGGPDFYWRIHQAEYSGVTVDPSTWGMYVVRRNGTSFDVWKDGVKTTATCGAGTDTYPNFTLGTDDVRTSPTAGATQHGELILSNQAIPDADIAALRTSYVIPKWATP